MFDWLFQKKYPTISVLELVDILRSSPPNVAFIDVRGKEEWDKGHIAGFQHIPFYELKSRADELIKNKQVYFICHSGGRSGRACDILAEYGYTGAVNVLGGMSEWVARGLPVER